MNIWETHGFRENPYDVSPIAGDEEGERLLVGRDGELAELATQLASSTTHPTLEGQNGVGKTSLVAVAGYKVRRRFEATGSGQLLIPMAEPFQLLPDLRTAEFVTKVFTKVAHAILANEQVLRRLHTSLPNTDDVRRWLESPLLGGGGGGLSAGGIVGVSAPTAPTANSSQGFAQSGFSETVRTWLQGMFPSPRVGAFVCVIDNLELLETSKAAREQLEALRDELLRVAGLRWVLCGARGIVRSVASSSRLQGVLADPIEIEPIADAFVAQVVDRRVAVYGSPESYVPVESDGFRHLYDACNRNLRTAMKFSQDYAVWLARNNEHPETSRDKLGMLEAWMSEMADRYEKDSASLRGQRAWEVFDGIAEAGGSISPGDFEKFGFESMQAMRPHIKALEDAQLLHSSIDDKDGRRKTIEISARGWVVRYKRANYKAQ